MQEDKEKYALLINKYKYIWAKLRSLINRAGDKTQIIILDGERDQVHNELRQLARKIGKSSQDVDIDILTNEKNLADRNLPEFKLLRITDPGLNKPHYSTVNGADVLEPSKDRSDMAQEDLAAKEIDLFIPFGEETSWHLFDHQLFYEREPDNLERRRRAQSVVKQNQNIASFVEICSYKTFHRGIRLFGVGFSSKNLNRLMTFLSIHRKEISISKEFFDESQIQIDLKRIIQNDIDEILAYVDASPTADETLFAESASYLLERYRRDRIASATYIEDTLKNEILAKLEEMIREAKESDFRQKVEKEVENKLSEDDAYEGESSDSLKPFRERMGSQK